MAAYPTLYPAVGELNMAEGLDIEPALEPSQQEEMEIRRENNRHAVAETELPGYGADNHTAADSRNQINDPTIRRSTEVYGNRERKLQMARKLLMSDGSRIDYVLVYQLPELEADRNKVELALKRAPVQDEDKAIKNARKRVEFEAELAKKCRIEKEMGVDKRTVYVKIHAPFKVLLQEAEATRLKMPLSEEEHNERVELLGMDLATKTSKFCTAEYYIKKFKFLNFVDTGIPDDPEYYSATFRVDKLHEFRDCDNEEKFFSDSQRALLTYSILDSVRYAKKEGQIGIKRLINNATYTDCFPLHDGPFEEDPERESRNRRLLYDQWGKLFKFYRKQPHDLIRNYFGEKVAIYFVWLGYYTRALIPVSIIGILIFLYGLGTFQDQLDAKELCSMNMTMCPLCDSCDTWFLQESCTAYKFAWVFDNGATIVFAFIMAIWASVFLDFWKRTNARVAYNWDLRDFDEEEPDRPQFKGVGTRKNPITGEMEKYYPKSRRWMKVAGAVAVVVSMLALVIMVLISVIVYRLAVRVALFKSSDDPNSSARKNSGIASAITASILNLISILILNMIYGKLAIVLTDWENHRKESAYESALAFKFFLFQFVNSYASLFYVAFFKGQDPGYPGNYNTFFGYRQDECPEYGCLLELTIQLSIIMVGKQTINNIQEVGIPLVKAWLKKRKSSKTHKENKLLPWEDEFVNLEPYPRLGMFYEYLEMIIQFGFVTLFVAAFPLGPLFALGNNILEIRVDAGKLCNVYRRPPATRAANIGVWEGVLTFVSIFSVLTNGLVIAITSSYITKKVYDDRFHTRSGYINITHPISPEPGAVCHYASLRDPDGHKGSFFYEVWATRLGFLLIFEHAVFITKFIVQYIIPDVPADIVLKTKREAFLAKQALEGKLSEPDKRKLEELKEETAEQNGGLTTQIANAQSLADDSDDDA
eukprot:m.159045 g.159045  ORF g.159045 m.159045 type:complete len:933 (+) comp17033_c0_seq2:80-2878(+)